jgi:hypothetical protein
MFLDSYRVQAKNGKALLGAVQNFFTHLVKQLFRVSL